MRPRSYYLEEPLTRTIPSWSDHRVIKFLMLPYYTLGHYFEPLDSNYQLSNSRFEITLQDEPSLSFNRLFYWLRILGMGGLITIGVLFFKNLFDPWYFFDPIYPLCAMISLLLLEIAKIGRASIPPQRSKVTFNRYTGQVEWHHAQGHLLFQGSMKNIKAYVTNHPYGYRELYYSLILEFDHDLIVLVQNHFIIDMIQLWFFLLQYMDPKQSLPDIPPLEPYRHKDTVTLQQDNIEERDPHYWRHQKKLQVSGSYYRSRIMLRMNVHELVRSDHENNLPTSNQATHSSTLSAANRIDETLSQSFLGQSRVAAYDKAIENKSKGTTASKTK